MKRKKIFSVLSSLVISILLVKLTLLVTNLAVDAGLIVIWFAYFGLACAVSSSILAIITKKSKENYYQLLSTINAFFAIVSLIFSLNAKIAVIKESSYVIFVCTFIMYMIFWRLWIKTEKN